MEGPGRAQLVFCLFVINGKVWSDPCSSSRVGLLGRSLLPTRPIPLTACPLLLAPRPPVWPLALNIHPALPNSICTFIAC